MPMSDNKENEFWIQLMGDHAITLGRAIHPKNQSEMQIVQQYKATFESLLARARQPLKPDELTKLYSDEMGATEHFRRFLLQLLKMQVLDGIQINIQPVLFNQMVALAENYLGRLSALLNKKEYERTPYGLHLFWLPVFIAQASNILNQLGIYYMHLRERARYFVTYLANLYLRALEMSKVFKIGVTDFPMANRIADDIESTLEGFAVFIVDLDRLVQNKEIPGLLDILTIDHVYRMLCYYLTELSDITDVKKPACDPAGPRRGG